ncbi:hypothetical protein ACU8V4_08005 [Pseudoalteromonas mariniglutinosa]
MDSSSLKISRAENHLSDLTSLLRKKKPFSYCLETNFKTGERATYAKKNEQVCSEAAILIGDVVHNLRCALDHVYWDCTNQFAKSDGERNKIQFPVCNDEKGFRESVLTGLPKRVSTGFSDALEGLKPYRNGGNVKLCAVHDLDVLDKHKLLIPVGDYTSLSAERMKALVPDFPIASGTFGFGCNKKDIVWNIKPMTWTQRRKAKIPPSNIKEQELNVKVNVVLRSEVYDFNEPVDVLLAGLVSEVKTAVQMLCAAKP